VSKLPADIRADLIQRYRDLSKFDNARSAKATRAELSKICATLDAAAVSLRAPYTGNPDITGENAQRAAWRAIGSICAERGIERPLQEGAHIADILTEWSMMAILAAQRLPLKHEGSALRMIASTLWSLRVVGFNCSSTLNGDGVTELQAIAKDADARHVTREAARDALKGTKPKRKGIIRPKNRRE
jgi:hypothetical protein